MRKYIVKSVCCTMLALLISACTSATPIAMQLTHVLSTATQQATREAPSEVPSPPSTQTPLPTRISVSTPTIQPINVPVPTLSAIETTKLIGDLLATNGDCELPCWWGISPGEEPTPDNINFVMSVPDHRITNDLIGFYAQVTGGNTDAGRNYDIKAIAVLASGIVSNIRINSATTVSSSEEFTKDWQEYTLHRMLTKLGKPTEVRMGWNSISTDPNSDIVFTMDVLYDDRGIAIHYWEDVQKRGGRYLVCPSFPRLTSIGLLLTKANDATHFRNTVNNWDRYNTKLTLPIDEMANMSIDDFYNTFKDTSDMCFSPI